MEHGEEYCEDCGEYAASDGACYCFTDSELYED